MLKLKTRTNAIRIEKNIIRRYFYIGSLSAIALIVSFLSLTYTQSLEKELAIKIEQLSTSIIKEKKLFLRNAVERTFFLIDNVRAQVKREHADKELTEAQIESISVQQISALIRSLRLVNDGYIWVNHIIDYGGGDNYAVRLIHPNLPDSEGMLLSTDMTDSQGNKPYAIELEGINQHGELYFEYYFKKMNSEKIAHKISFAKLYKPYDWVVASGVYLDDLDLLIAEETAKMQETHNQQKIHSLAIALLTILSAIAIMVFFEKRIRSLIISYEAQIKSHTNRLEILSTIDSLTGLYNRFKLDNVFTYELNKARRYKKRFSIIIADLDNFKQVNDTYGHQIGDKVIQELATVLTNNARCTDTVGRWGGEEFLIICPDTDLQGAKRFAEKIRQAVKQQHFPVIHDLTCSFGVTSFNAEDTQQSMMQRADQALYYAKENGRNRVITADL